MSGTESGQGVRACAGAAASRSRALTVVAAPEPAPPRLTRSALAPLALIPALHAAVWGFNHERHRIPREEAGAAVAVGRGPVPAPDASAALVPVPGSQGRSLRYAGTASVVLPRAVREVVLSGRGADATVTGNGQGDTFVIEAGSWRIDGGPGTNVAVYPTEAGSHAIRLVATNAAVVTGPEGTQTLTNVPTLRFARSQVVFRFSTAAAHIVRVYDAVLQRPPDLLGGTHFLDALEKGEPLVALAAAILSAPEGRQHYGPDLSNAAFVDALYGKALRRAPDAAGRARWIGALRDGRSRAWVLAEIAESPEHVAYVDAHEVVGLAVERPL